jgi:SagB-type dehydrogenase family enzyme
MRAPARARPSRFRRSPHLVCHWSGRLVVYNYETARAVPTTPLAVEILDYFGADRSLADAEARFAGYPRAQLARAIRLLERRGLLERVGRRRATRGLDAWQAWNPAAGFFHFSTKDMAFVEDGPDDVRAAGKRPPAPKRVEGAPRVALPEVRADGEFPRVLRSRRTWRQFARQPVPLEQLATLLGLTFGLQHTAPLPGGGRMHLRTSPSPGASQSLEAYVLARRIEGLPRGLYHYAADRHELERLKSAATRRQLLAYVPTQSWYAEAAALVLLTAVFPRVWGRYDYPRAYRAVLIEAGHFCQTFLLTATWLGLAPFCSMALADSRIERDLGIDGVTESVLYAAGVGVRPPGVEWAPTPSPERKTTRAR